MTYRRTTAHRKVKSDLGLLFLGPPYLHRAGWYLVHMTRPRIYVETTIPSFYHDVRTAPDIVVRRDWTRQWWDGAVNQYELLTSPAVLDELAAGPLERTAPRLALMRGLPLLAVEPGILEIVATYVRHKLMPADPGGDALHLALASYHKCDFLVTWNCQHLANANKFGHIRRVNSMLGLFVPVLVTPLELLGENDEAES
jgi:predicted nucleic acid-binding protein